MFVAPFAGAWIEIKGADVLSLPLFVAPFAGAWIEIRDMLQCDNIYECVAPFAGAWIEICEGGYIVYKCKVAPFAGAWIEIIPEAVMCLQDWSLPSRERGLK